MKPTDKVDRKLASIQLERDRVLVKGILRGEEKSVQTFFDTYLPRLYRYALHRLANKDEIDDVVQATLSQGVRRLETWRGESTLLTWLVSICRHEISREIARTRRDADLMEPFLSNEIVRATVETIEVDDEETTEQIALRAELAQLVRLALDQLPEHYAKALEMKYVLGNSSVEIANTLSISDSATQSLLARARRAFQEIYGESFIATTNGR